MGKEVEVKNLNGQSGGIFLATGETHDATGSPEDVLFGIICLTDTVIAEIEMAGFDGTESELVGVSLSIGTPIYGLITKIVLTSGLIQGLKH